jgi:hypothetical protein
MKLSPQFWAVALICAVALAALFLADLTSTLLLQVLPDSVINQIAHVSPVITIVCGVLVPIITLAAILCRRRRVQ